MLKQVIWKSIIPLGILGSILIILINPLNNLAKELESTKATTYTNNELIKYSEKYRNLIFNINNELRIKGYPSIVDYALSTDENIELLIKIPEVINAPKTKEIQQIVNNVLQQSKSNSNLFQVNLSSYYEPPIKNKNRLSYYDLMSYILEDMVRKGYKTFSLDYSILPDTIEITVKIDSISENSKNEIQQIVDDVLKQNKFESDMFQLNLSNYNN